MQQSNIDVPSIQIFDFEEDDNEEEETDEKPLKVSVKKKRFIKKKPQRKGL